MAGAGSIVVPARLMVAVCGMEFAIAASRASDVPGTEAFAFSTGLESEHAGLLVNLLSNDHSRAAEDGKHHLVLEPYGYRWYRVGGLDYLLKRSDIDADEAGKTSHPA